MDFAEVRALSWSLKEELQVSSYVKPGKNERVCLVQKQ